MPEALPIQDFIRRAAKQQGVPETLALAVAEQESGFNPTAIGPEIEVGGQKMRARGTFQIIPPTAATLGINPDDPAQNIQGGVKYLRQLLDQHQGDLTKVLATYGGVVHNTTYVPGVQVRMQKFAQAGASGQPGDVQPPPAAQPTAMPASTPLPPGANRGMLPQSTPTTTTETPYETPAEREWRLQMPFVKALPEMALYAAAPELLIPRMLRMAPLALRLARAGVPAARAVATATEAAAQATVAAGTAATLGDDPTVAATIAGASPVVGALVTSMAPVIRGVATKKLARILERGQRGAITPAKEQQLAQAANDLIDLPLTRTWRQLTRQLEARATEKSKTLVQALAGPLGDVGVPVAPVMRAFTDLKDDALHYLPAGKGQYTAEEFREGTAKAVDVLLDKLGRYQQAYGPNIPARELHDLKSVWWEAVYGRAKQAGRPLIDVREQLTTVEKLARTKGAATIARVFEQHLPKVADLDAAFAQASRLKTIVQAVEMKARTGSVVSQGARYAVAATGAVAGFAGGAAVGHPYFGIPLGAGMARQLFRAVESPRWHLLPLKLRRNLAAAIAGGSIDETQRLLRPVLITIFGDEDNLLPTDRALP